ncbi:MAG: tRNA (adenosine(37)-N6)-dimethylallyltransferase MiaA [SAR324 cluster bacterium]|uniref:tRNA dimethylallyltransferase n=1 Tax=SAR324 cluster bacterium TaxID=2024889 RepID=A0A2A4T3W7_9DELT|nr:MAG: tRNA (adenosine(37)-N6)-dimethylallyltransferase MiaA [SAR324 cluster bacterium]
MDTDLQKIIIITGPTASGKTKLAIRLAQKVGGEIISADSRQVYRGMDIGTGKDLQEYGNIKYHLIDILKAGEEFSVSKFQAEALKVLGRIRKRGAVPIICGGTGHYLKALIEDYSFEEPETDLQYTLDLEDKSREELYEELKQLQLWEQHHWEDDSKRRIARAIEKAKIPTKKQESQIRFQEHYLPQIYYTAPERSLLRRKIKKRLIERLEEGMVQEVENLLQQGIPYERLERYGLEYKWVSRYVHKQIASDHMIEKLHTEICRFAKRQVTFIRYLEKNGHSMIPITSMDTFLEEATLWLEEKTKGPTQPTLIQ